MKAIKLKIFGLILAGGHSRRMGRDKALLEFHGKPQVEYIYDLLGKYCSKIFLSKRRGQKAYKGIASINDSNKFPNHGPLTGILSAMEEHPDADWLVIACDLPFISEATLQTLVSGRNPRKIATAFISSQDALPEPLCAIWERHAYGPSLKLLNKGVHCPREILIKSKPHLLKQKDFHWLDNVNTPSEYELARKSNIT